MNEPQVWTLIGVFAAALFGLLTLMTTMFVRVIRTEMGSLRGEMGSLRTEFKAEIDGLRTEVRSEIAGVNRRIDSLDRDVQALVKHTFGIDRG